jgi:hypothetical protein
MSSLHLSSRALGALLMAGVIGCVTPPWSFETAPKAVVGEVRQSGKPADAAGRKEYVSNGAIANAPAAGASSADVLWASASNALEAIQRVQPAVLVDLGSPITVVLNGRVCETQDCLKKVSPSAVASVFLLSRTYAHYRFGVPGAALEVSTR